MYIILCIKCWNYHKDFFFSKVFILLALTLGRPARWEAQGGRWPPCTYLGASSKVRGTGGQTTTLHEVSRRDRSEQYSLSKTKLCQNRRSFNKCVYFWFFVIFSFWVIRFMVIKIAPNSLVRQKERGSRRRRRKRQRRKMHRIANKIIDKCEKISWSRISFHSLSL